MKNIKEIIREPEQKAWNRMVSFAEKENLGWNDIDESFRKLIRTVFRIGFAMAYREEHPELEDNERTNC